PKSRVTNCRFSVQLPFGLGARTARSGRPTFMLCPRMTEGVAPSSRRHRNGRTSLRRACSYLFDPPFWRERSKHLVERLIHVLGRRVSSGSRQLTHGKPRGSRRGLLDREIHADETSAAAGEHLRLSETPRAPEQPVLAWVRTVGIEPTRRCRLRILRPVCLPVPPRPRGVPLCAGPASGSRRAAVLTRPASVADCGPKQQVKRKGIQHMPQEMRPDREAAEPDSAA